MPPRNLLEALGGTLSSFGQQVPGILQQDVQSRRLFEQDRQRQAQQTARGQATERRFTETERRNRLTDQRASDRLAIAQRNLELSLAREARLGQPTPTTAPKGPTGAQRLKATEDIFGEQQSGALGEASRFLLGKGEDPITTIEELEAAAEGPFGLGREKDVESFNPFTTFGNVPDPDSTLARLRDQFLQVGSPAHRQAFQAGDSLQTLRPSLFPQGQADVSRQEAIAEMQRRGIR